MCWATSFCNETSCLARRLSCFVITVNGLNTVLRMYIIAKIPTTVKLTFSWVKRVQEFFADADSVVLNAVETVIS